VQVSSVHASVDVAMTGLLPVVAYFLMRLVRQVDDHGSKLSNHAQRLSQLDGRTDDA
jgi:hypothetical protein